MYEHKLYWYEILSYRVIDGDSIECEIDLGFDIHIREVVRLRDIECPETRTKNLDEKAKGLAAKDFVQRMLDDADEIYLDSAEYRRGKYGRCLGIIYIHSNMGVLDLNIELLKAGHARPYGET